MNRGAPLLNEDARLTWSLCIATLNRVETLARSVNLALAQTRPPEEVVIVDASEAWEENRDRIASLFGEGLPRLIYLRPARAASAAQRNMAVEAASGAIVFLFDDDTLMFPDCAEKIMALYEGPSGAGLAAISAINDPVAPDTPQVAEARKSKGGGGSIASRIRGSAFGRWVWREVFMMATTRNFVPYDDRPLVPAAPRMPDGTHAISLMSGYATTVRREIALKEPYEDALLAYCPGEDLDASYRFGRHGQNAAAPAARVHHFEAAAGRIKRKRATALGLLNIAYVTRRHSRRLPRHVVAYYVMALRRLLAEFLKDSLSRRWDYPQFRAILIALRHSPRVFRLHPDELRPWYVDLQKRILTS